MKIKRKSSFLERKTVKIRWKMEMGSSGCLDVWVTRGIWEFWNSTFARKIKVQNNPTITCHDFYYLFFLNAKWRRVTDRPSKRIGNRKEKRKKTRPDTRHKMRLVCVLFTFENNTGHTDGRTDTTSYRNATAHLKIPRNPRPTLRGRASGELRWWARAAVTWPIMSRTLVTVGRIM